MKILHVNKFFYVKGGSETYLFSIIDGLRQAEHTVAEFAMQHKLNRDSKWSHHFTETIDYDTSDVVKKLIFASKIIYSFEAKHKIRSLLNEFSPDIVHLHIFQHQLSPSILPEIKKHNIPVVYTAHDLKLVCPNYKMYSNGSICEKCRTYKYYQCLLNI